MKFFFKTLIISTLFFLSSCEQEEAKPFPCETLGEDIQSILDRNTITFISVSENGNSVNYSGTPTIEGCLLTVDGFSFNLDQVNSYYVLNESIQLVF